MSNREWISFHDRLPSAHDADAAGMIDMNMVNVVTGETSVRTGMWNWVQPTLSNAAFVWSANGILGWLPRAGKDSKQ